MAGECPLWVGSGHSVPLWPATPRMSAIGQKRTLALRSSLPNQIEQQGKAKERPADHLECFSESAIAPLVVAAVIVIDNNGQHHETRRQHGAIHDPRRGIVQVDAT